MRLQTCYKRHFKRFVTVRDWSPFDVLRHNIALPFKFAPTTPAGLLDGEDLCFHSLSSVFHNESFTTITMNTVEEAASLFGSAESDSDIFGSTLRSEGHGNDPNVSTPTTGEPSTGVDALFGAASTDDGLENTYGPPSDMHQGYDHNAAKYSDSASAGDSHHTRESQWHDQNQQWNTYDHSHGIYPSLL
jgi:hypothetical protein